MSDQDFQSLVLALNYRVDGLEQRWTAIDERASRLTGIGAHHVVFYVSTSDLGRVLVTMGIHHHSSVETVLRSPALFEWFDADGVNDIPAVFAGSVLAKADLSEGDDYRGAVIISAVSTIDDVAELVARVQRGLDALAGAGVRRLRMYRAFDDEHEVMTLLEFDSPASAQHWTEHLDSTAEWMSGARSRAHPNLFVGQLRHVADLEAGS